MSIGSRNFSFYLFPSIVKSALAIFLLLPLTTYYLDPRDFGLFAILSVIASVLLPLASVGGSWVLGANYFTLETKDRKELLFNILFLDMVLRAGVVFFLWLAKDYILPAFVEEYRVEHNMFFLLLLLSVMCSVFWPTVSYLLIIQRRSRMHALFEVWQISVNITAMIFLLTIMDMRESALFWTPLITNMLSFVFEILFLRNHIAPVIRLRWIREIVTTGVPTIGANVFESISNSADRYFIQKWLSLEALGIYSHSQTYATMLKTINKAFARTVNPAALECFSLGKKPEHIRYQLRGWYACLFAGGVFVALFMRDILSILTHGKFVAAAPLVVVWVYLIFSHTLGLASGQFLLSRKATKLLTAVQVTGSLFSFFLVAGATYFFGLMGAAAAIVFSNVLIQLIYISKAKSLGNPYRDHGAVLLPVLALTLVALVSQSIDIPILYRILIGMLAIFPAILYACGQFRHAHAYGESHAVQP